MDIKALLWDYDISTSDFLCILRGATTHGRLDADWAARRVVEYARYPDLLALISYASLVKNWPRWRSRIRAESRRRGIDFLVQWIPVNRPDLLEA
ncbi:MAG: hypothetical protein IPP94_09250 [Ignavibacteria bacterium]|nr:hypothetical protein [Ignavibacteria bacterium]